MHVYLAPDRHPPRRCTPLPKDRRELEKRLPTRTEPPLVRVPLTGVRPNGRTYTLRPTTKPRRLRARATVDLRQGRFRPAHISVPLGARVTWRFADTTPHNVLFANGPSLIGTPTLSGGATHTSQFRVPGRYELFCYLHPVTMHEVVDVREPAASRGLSGSG
jgi:plastocyanin